MLCVAFILFCKRCPCERSETLPFCGWLYVDESDLIVVFISTKNFVFRLVDSSPYDLFIYWILRKYAAHINRYMRILNALLRLFINLVQKFLILILTLGSSFREQIKTFSRGKTVIQVLSTRLKTLAKRRQSSIPCNIWLCI